jgi:hypothetical protein
MTPYIILLIIPLLFGMSKSQSKKNIALMVYFIALFLILSLRSVNVGTDLANYGPKFKVLVNAEWSDIPYLLREIGYGYLNKAVGYVTHDFQIFLVIVAAITVIPLYFLYRSPDKWNYLKVVIFMNMAIFPMMFSGLRQTIAISLGVCAYLALLHKKIWIYALLVVCAFYVHHSAIMLIMLYPLSLFNIKPKYLLLLIPLFIVLFIFRTQVAEFMLVAMSSSDDLAIYGERYGDFSDTGAYGSLVLFMIFTIISYLCTDEHQLTKHAIFLRNILVVASFMQMVALINPVTMRINYYFIAFVPIAVPICLSYCKTKYKAVVNVLCICLAVILTGFYINRAFWGQDVANVYPYEAFWETSKSY